MILKKSLLHFAVPSTAILIASVAAFFSIYGLSKGFAGASTEVAIMATVLELGKLVGVSYLYLHWNTMHWFRKAYGVLSIFVLMCLTSIGIYGFLQGAYQTTANKIEIVTSQQNVLNTKKTVYIENINRIKNDNTLKVERIKLLNNLRNKQDSRLDNESGAIRRTAQKNIQSSDAQIIVLQKQIDSSNVVVSQLSDSISKFEIGIIQLGQNKDISNEIGPYKYVAKSLGISLDQVINWLIIVIIVVFDPFALSLIIASNQLFKKKDEDDEPKIVTETEIEKLVEHEPVIEESISTDEMIIEEKPDVLPIDFEEETESIIEEIIAEENQSNDIPEIKAEEVIEPVEEIVEEIIDEIAEPDKEITDFFFAEEDSKVNDELLKLEEDTKVNSIFPKINFKPKFKEPTPAPIINDDKVVEIIPHDGGIRIR
jgi:hypothetical protein